MIEMAKKKEEGKGDDRCNKCKLLGGLVSMSGTIELLQQQIRELQQKTCCNEREIEHQRRVGDKKPSNQDGIFGSHPY